MHYEGMTSAQLLSAILLCNKDSTTVLWYLLSERLREKLQLCYNQCTSETGMADYKTFDDYLTDFYIYLYEGHPDYVTHPTQFHYLQTISDNTKVESWMQRSFKLFLKNERRALDKLTEALPAYIQEQKYDHLNEPQIELTRIAFCLAWYNQHESVEDRYIFFRSMKKKVVKSYDRSEELSDEETATALGKKYASYRSQASRCCAEVKRLMTEMTHQDIVKLDANSLLLVNRISNVDEDTLDDIINSLVVSAERQLPQYRNILDIRDMKRLQKQIEERVLYEKLEARLESQLPEEEGSASTPASSIRHSRIPSFKSSRKSQSSFEEKILSFEELKRERKQSFVKSFISSFKLFLDL